MNKTAHRILHGIPVSPGIAAGPVYIHSNHRLVVTPRHVSDVEAEVLRFNEAVERTRDQLKKTREMVNSKIDKTHAAIFDAQQVLLDDPLIIESCRREIRAQKMNAEYLLQQIVQQIKRLVDQVDHGRVSIHDLDVLDVASRITENLLPEPPVRLDQLAKNVIIVAHDLHPSETARLNRRHVLGIITEAGGPTSHFAILAKALKIPAIVGVEGIGAILHDEDTIIIDSQVGTVIVQPTKMDLERMQEGQKRLRAREESLHKLRDLPCVTTDGFSIDLAANIELPTEIESVKQSGARGIGLFRSEFFYIDCGCFPSEEEQFKVYREVAQEMAPLPVTCRTLDLGGDKFISEPDVNSVVTSHLGLRAIRLSLSRPDIFRTQMRAILRASAFGRVRMMFPLITDISEVRKAKALYEEIRQELRKKSIAFDEKMPVGIMIETPSAALTSDILADEVDFFSLGTNDLVQYTLAVDRGDESVATLYDQLHPSVIDLIKRTIESGRRAGIRVSLCGEMAADPAMAVLLVGLGIDELSMSPVAIPEVKRIMRSLTLDDIRQLRTDVLHALRGGNAHAVLARFMRKYTPARPREKVL